MRVDEFGEKVEHVFRDDALVMDVVPRVVAVREPRVDRLVDVYQVRDRVPAVLGHREREIVEDPIRPVLVEERDLRGAARPARHPPVSYTHLTLPTILRV